MASGPSLSDGKKKKEAGIYGLSSMHENKYILPPSLAKCFREKAAGLMHGTSLQSEPELREVWRGYFSRVQNTSNKY